MEKTKLPDLKFEKKYWKAGMEYVAGADEVGKGCFAGPLVTGCVIFSRFEKRVTEAESVPSSPRSQSRGGRMGRASGRTREAASHPLEIPQGIVINDSKQMRPRQREKSEVWIKENALTWGIGQASVAQINRLGIKKASEIAFRKAIKNCKTDINYLLIDAFYIPYVKGLRRKNQKAIIKGDTKSVSIAAASIIAKVYRDRLMQKLGNRPKYRKYGWGRNKGYGTKEHRNAIQKYGTTRQHRQTFVATWLKNSKKNLVSSS